MKLRYEATHAALEHFDHVDKPAFDALRKTCTSLPRLDEARKRAADRVRAAFLHDTEDFNTPEFVDLMSVERIRAAAHDTFLGAVLGLLP